MALSQQELRKAIKDILKDADLDSLSAKKVRLILEEKYSTDLSEKKKVIDQLVMELIEEIQDGKEDSEEKSDPSSDEESEEEPPQKKKKPSTTATVSKPKPKPKKTPEKSEEAANDNSDSSEDDVNDEEMAQKLQEELNSSGRRTRSRNTPKKQKKERKTPAKGERKGTSAYSKPCLLSQELAEVMGADRLARNEVVKKMWQIVKERNLQDPSNKQFMICDDQLLPIFGKKKVKTFGMMKYLKNHIKDAKDVAS